jgi:hypothetical protein
VACMLSPGANSKSGRKRLREKGICSCLQGCPNHLIRRRLLDTQGREVGKKRNDLDDFLNVDLNIHDVAWPARLMLMLVACTLGVTAHLHHCLTTPSF